MIVVSDCADPTFAVIFYRLDAYKLCLTFSSWIQHLIASIPRASVDALPICYHLPTLVFFTANFHSSAKRPQDVQPNFLAIHSNCVDSRLAK